MRALRAVLPFALVACFVVRAFAVEGNWTGVLAPAPADAKEGVVATLTIKEGDKDVVMNLTAEGDVAKTLKEWAAKGAKATVRGNNPDKATIKVSKVEKAE